MRAFEEEKAVWYFQHISLHYLISKWQFMSSQAYCATMLYRNHNGCSIVLLFSKWLTRICCAHCKWNKAFGVFMASLCSGRQPSDFQDGNSWICATYFATMLYRNHGWSIVLLFSTWLTIKTMSVFEEKKAEWYFQHIFLQGRQPSDFKMAIHEFAGYVM